MTIADLTTDEMVDDYLASQADNQTIERLNATEQYQSRYDGNQAIMDTIRAELERRGELGRVDNANNN